MFRRIRAWWSKRHRTIFHFWDGTRDRAADPMGAMRLIEQDEKYVIGETDTFVDIGDQEAIDTTLAMIRRVFNVKTWADDQPGLTEIETLELLANFCIYIDSLKKSTQTIATSPSPTEESISTESDEPTMSDSADSISTKAEPEPKQRIESD